jgi:hypothetical protein
MPYDFHPQTPRGPFWALVAILLLVGAGLLGVGIDGLHENHRFAMNSASTQGWVDANYLVSNMGRWGGMHSQRALSYSYSVGGMTYSSGVKIVAASTGRRYRAHDSIPVLYLRDDPGDSRPDLPDEDATYQRVPFPLIALGGLGLGGGVATIFQRRKTIRHC